MKLEELLTLADAANFYADDDLLTTNEIVFMRAAKKYLPELVRRLMRLRELLPDNPTPDGHVATHVSWSAKDFRELSDLIHSELEPT